jgi:hypothetical protein
LLLWLLIAALPVQGLAAAVRVSCAQAHHGLPAATETAHCHGDDAADHARHHHAHDGAAMASFDDAHVPGTSAGGEKSAGYASAYCSACAACCTGALAPPPTVLRPPERGSSDTILLSPPASATGYIPAGLERPPKAVSA